LTRGFRRCLGVTVLTLAIGWSARAQPGPLPVVPFPRLEARALAGNLVVLPDSARGHVALVCLAFKRNLHKDLVRWLDGFETELSDTVTFRTYDLSMAGSRVPWFIRPLMNAAMRRSTPPARRSRTIPFYGDVRGFAEALGVPDHSRVWVYLLDREGQVRWRRCESFTPSGLTELVAAAAVLGCE